jgi:hypothetical protein
MPLFTAVKATRASVKRGGVAVMALIVALVTVTLFQGYMTNVVSDAGAGETLDLFTQAQGERIAIERVVKEAVLEYYEIGRMGGTPPTISELIESFLDNMESGGVTYAVTTAASLPSYQPTLFWPNLDTDGNTACGSFELIDTNLSNFFVVLRRVGQYMPAPTLVPQLFQDSEDHFTYTITRSDGPIFNVHVRLYQVPVTDYNVVAYAVAKSKTSIPDAPPDLPDTISDAITAGDIHALCMSKLGAANSIANNGNEDGEGLDFPYSFRELFSGASLVWEYLCYNADYIKVLAPKDYRLAGGVVQPLAMYSLSALEQEGMINGAVPPESMGFDNYQRVGGVIQYDPVTGQPIRLDTAWTVDLNTLSDAKIDGSAGADTFRRIYVQAPGTMTLNITDSAAGGGVTTPVVIWVNGWSVTDAVTYEAAPTTINLVGDLRDQEIFIYVCGSQIVPSANARMKGMIVLDDLFGGIDSSTGYLTLDGLISFRADSPYVDLEGVAVNSQTLPALRRIAPRFLLVDAQSEVVNF